MDGMELIRSQRGMMAEIARGLGLSRAAITRWTKVPAERMVEVEKITSIPRQLLRPDLWSTPRHRR